MTDAEKIDAAVLGLWKPSYQGRMWQWWEENIKLDSTAPIQGSYSTAMTPMVRWVADAMQDPRTRMGCAIVSRQSSKTQSILIANSYFAKEDPASTAWVMATDMNAKEFVKKRLRPALEHCEVLQDILPRHRGKSSLNIIQFSTMNLLIRGSNSRIGLQSDPLKRIFCDERAEWQKGAIDILRKTLRTHYDSLEFSMGTAGDENDELHVDWKRGSQTFFHWHCPHCGHSQPFRFGRKASAFFPEARDKGGLRWDKNDVTCPNGVWNRAEVKKTVRYECENCEHRFSNNEKMPLLNSIHAFHRNPAALPEKFSCHWSALYMPWKECDWPNIVDEFLAATEELKNNGNLEPLKVFVTMTLGEPWQEQKKDLDEGALGRRRGGYHLGELDLESKSFRVLTADVQEGYLVYVARQHFAGVRSRLMACGTVPDFGGLRALQVKLEIENKWVAIDSAHNPHEVGQACLLNGWVPFLGDDAREFTRQEWDEKTKEMRSVKSHWKAERWDSGLGTGTQGRRIIQRFSWCKEHYLNRLYLHLIQAKLGQWSIADDTPAEYLKQVRTGYKLVSEISNNVETFKWEKDARRDFADCELEQLVVCDAGNLI